MSEHLSGRLLEQASIDDLPVNERERVTAHLAECATCRQAITALQGEARTHLEAHPPERFMMQVSARRARSRRTPIVAVVSILAAAALVLVWPRPHDGDVRLKGEGLSVVVRRGAETRILLVGESIAEGDTLQLSLTSARATRVSAWLVDGEDVHVVAEELALPAGEQPVGPSATIDPPCHALTVVVARDREVSIAEVRDAAHGTPVSGLTTRRLRCR